MRGACTGYTYMSINCQLPSCGTRSSCNTKKQKTNAGGGKRPTPNDRQPGSAEERTRRESSRGEGSGFDRPGGSHKVEGYVEELQKLRKKLAAARLPGREPLTHSVPGVDSSGQPGTPRGKATVRGRKPRHSYEIRAGGS